MMQKYTNISLLLEEMNRLRQENTKLKASLFDYQNRETALKNAKYERDAILDQVRETILYVDTDMRIKYVNSIDAETIGLLPAQMVGRYCYEAYHGRNEPCSNCNIRKVIETCQPQIAETVFSDGILRLSRAYPIQDDDGKLLGVFEMGLDLTESKLMEEELRRLDRLKLMGEIAGGIAHEIRNPMTVVWGYLQIMQLEEESASHKKRFATMIGEIDRANTIISEFLSLARYAPPNLKIQSINSILTDLLPLIQADAAEHGIVISLNLSDTPEINLDSKQIRQVVLNLVRNGIEAMSRYGELTIKTRLKGDRVVLSIKDRGNGIPPEALEKLGKPFFTTKENGTGLGLPVCYRIVESHNARIEIKTGKRGTTFMVSFPMSSPQDGVSI
jgi:PAS domain S-box-containing protein